MSNLFFTEQRDTEGDVIYDEQQQSDTTSAEAFLVANSTLTATLKFYTVDTSANLIARSTLTATLRSIRSRMSVNLIARSQLTASLKSIKSTMDAGLSSTATLVARLMSIENPINVLSANLVASSTLSARLFTELESNIPIGAIVKAVPTDSEKLQIVRYRGDTYADSFFVFDDRNGNLLDLTGCELRMTLATKRNPTSDDIVYVIVGYVDRDSKGLVYFTPTAEQADRVGFYYWDIQLREAQGTVRTLVAASYVYKSDITA